MRPNASEWGPTAVLLALSLLGGCASQDAKATGGGPDFGGSTGSGTGIGGNSNPATGEGGASGTADGGTNLPPETEVDSSFEVPVATGRFVWVANPQSGRVAYVDAATMVVRTVEAGNGPTYLAPLP